MTKHHAALIAILRAHPCPQCGAVEVLDDAPIPGATCDCGRKEGCQVRWGFADIWSQLRPGEQRIVIRAEREISEREKP